MNEPGPAGGRAGRPSVLFLDKVFLKRRPDPLRGVELFNLRLLRELLALGFPTTLVADTSWREAAGAYLAGAPEPVWLGGGGPAPWIALRAAARLTRRRYDRLLVGNVGNGIIPVLGWLRARRVFARAVLVAHREASARFVRAYRSVPGHVVAVNGKIAEPFRASGYPSVQVDYGIFDSDRFTAPERRAADRVRFVVLGALDNAWKGADTALAAFRRLPADMRARSELHLASYLRPPPPEPGVVPHAWMAADEIPALLRRMDVMLCPSRDEQVMRETFSQAMVQGMLCGLPVVVNDLPILTEKLDRGGGLVFRDVDELAGHMERLAGDADLRGRLGREARATALERYVWDTRRFAERYLVPEGPA